MMVFMNETPTPDTRDTMREQRDAEKIAANVRAEVARKSLPADSIAALLGLHRNTVTSRLAGRSPFYAYEIARLAAVLDVSAMVLLAVDDNPVLPPRGVGPGIIGPTS